MDSIAGTVKSYYVRLVIIICCRIRIGYSNNEIYETDCMIDADQHDYHVLDCFSIEKKKLVWKEAALEL